jgi:outer membrane protein OmpA-like peptidoglycan-associated protein
MAQYNSSSGILLQAKQWYAIKVEYANRGFVGDGQKAHLQLYWDRQPNRESPIGATGGFRKLIPARYFSPLTKRMDLSPSSPIQPAKTLETKNKKKSTLRVIPIQSVQRNPSIQAKPADSTGAIKFVVGKAVILQNVLFSQGSHQLLPESFRVLNQLASLLKQNPTQRIEVSGHTDNVGDATANLILSEYRARKVRIYLINQGVATGQVEATGYGSKHPIGDNSLDSERPKNRRVEIRLLDD